MFQVFQGQTGLPRDGDAELEVGLFKRLDKAVAQNFDRAAATGSLRNRDTDCLTWCLIDDG